MKIFAYEVRDDEKKAFERLAEEYGVELTISTDVPSLQNAGEVAGFDGITMLGQGNISRELLEAYKQAGIRFLSTRTIGYNHIDLKAAKDLGIKVCNASYPPNGVADFTVMMILMSLRHYKQAMWRGYVNDFSLKGLQGRDLKDMTVGIMGTGRIGLQVIKNLTGFGCRILAYDVFENEEAKSMAQYVDLETLYRESDIISLHMPLLPSTRHIINAESIAKMKDGVIIVNCARGELTDSNALVDGIESMNIGALGMDTMEGEEGIIHADRRTDIIANRNWFYLHQFRNVIMTQHMAFYTVQAVDSMVRCGVEGIVKMSQDGTYQTMLTK
ncbi:D-isomer specific 2-hydroxyacid dehydrogenase family protein [Lacrimispora sp. 210928-DFI.3.58]|uniref:D-isomer specific 2-hydroxyacid dehydrogenase family protein n=1 Tax=Lacrimispora sp. 210928-DFI.3.58 TaxID=2883214 RepID=UPI001D05DD65|nr:D-isomer specific 2-hydroxyacid dehydrogenase family protein [Lacrimispora sp. 210928-DFI.3.58]MCB7317455.1 D-isomer specific 2-hydroxyacid dehydrogenase family protein [Lacrimispora sp. 210928-DFI.3.58]